MGIDAAAAHLILIDPTLASPLLPHPGNDDTLLIENLTSREQQVLQLLAEGLPNKNIARQLAISEHTVKFHVNAIMTKLGAQSRTEAVVRATRAGLIML
ncbi:MAG: response regulator transcription factor [Candidatus Promineifilaceae bacterium]